MSEKTALIVGAARNLGLGIATEYARRGWNVIGTVRGAGRTGLHDLADMSGGRVTVESLEMTEPEQIAALRERLAERTLDLLFVNAAIARGDVPIGDVPTEMFTEVMVTNALSPMRVVESFRSSVTPSGTIAVMSSRQGSLGMNTKGGQDVYRASKSALNQLMRCYAARYADAAHTLLLICPGHVRTGLGGPNAPLTVEQSVPGVVDTIERHSGEPGLQYLNYQNDPVPW
ncbi:SDR family oxidoreductase [Nocardia terpenica]|uniref:SDR family oxidoreductase n=1 Tax=Nocardia terpenica TaxID=455432 RepID=UPI001895C2FD|nr:SDR family oxidoreductase [Nocardia terpenica]MBF6060786.1 SDR family oxidoreductase [Nocardia terpenica]MBF6104046.1 SDR family oxidoreductase [Nocardia terpenica]MBF6111580.1 SDR family oxidoreductase [Nocardia terpenica]MBF6118267.1 SDR family oxidoreductase [Nocardia terpenica]MBF6156108.1 SDR family oxidoreductase [Nocardia terpenica]